MKFKKRILAMVMVVVMLFPTSVFAVSRPAASQVPVGTLIIGTHLIALRSLTPQIYEIAIKSAANENQHSIYYRSEFANEKWCDITKAENIFNLTATSGKAVDNAVIDALVLTHYTMEDGKTYDLNTENVVNLPDINSPYDTSACVPLKAVKTLADSLNAEGVGKKDIDKKNMANSVLQKDYHTKQTDAMDKQIAEMGAYINNLRDAKANEQTIKTAVELQQKLDNSRRVTVYNAIVQKAEEVINVAGKSNDDREAYNDLVSLLSDAQKKLNEEIQSLNGKTMSEGTTASEKKAYENETKMLDAIEKKDYTAANKAVQGLSDIDNINSKKIVNRENELATAMKMLTQLENEYKQQLAKGDTGALKKAVDSKNATEAKIEQDKIAVPLDDKRIALQNMVSAVEMRKLKSEKDSFMKDVISRAIAMKGVIPNDYAYTIAQANLQKYIDALLGIDSNVKGQSGVKSEAQKLSSELLGIKEKIKLALDKNDIEGADNLQKSATEVQNKIDGINKKTQAEIDDLLTQKAELDEKIDTAKIMKDEDAIKRLSAQKADIESQINDKKSELSTGAQEQSIAVGKLKNAILATISSPASTNADFAGAIAQAEQLAAYIKTNPIEATVALSEIQKELFRKEAVSGTLPEGLQNLREFVEKAIIDGTNAVNNQDNGNAVETIGGISAYNEKGVFDEVCENHIDYVPLSAIPYAMNLRLVIESTNTEVLSNGSKYYRFLIGSKTAQSFKGDIDCFGKVISQGDKIFVPRSFVEEELSLIYVRIPNKQKAVLMSKTAYEKYANPQNTEEQ